MTYAQTLIDKAKDVCGSYYKLSKAIDLAESTISEIRKGTRRLPLECVPILADMCQLDVQEAIARVMIEHAKGSKREGALTAILGKALAAGVAVLWVFSYSEHMIYGSGKTISEAVSFTLLIIVLSRAMALTLRFGARHAQRIREISPSTRGGGPGGCAPRGLFAVRPAWNLR